MNLIPSGIRQYATEDYLELVSGMRKKCTEFDRVSVDNFKISAQGDSSFLVNVRLVAEVSGVKYGTDFVWEYVIEDDAVYLGGSIEEITEDAVQCLREAVEDGTIVAKRGVRGQVILAAEGDEEIPGAGFLSEDPNDALDDSVDQIADQVEDVQGVLDEIQEDDVDIEKTNNIADHYIVECDVCHGIFISALMESNEPIRTIHGICPLCRKESDQYIKWIVRDAKSDQFDDEDLEFGVPDEDQLV